MTFGEKLSKLRKERNYTQEQLAELLEVSRQSVSKWESDIAYPETDKLIKLAKLFDCSTDYLLNDACTERGESAAAAPLFTWEKLLDALKLTCKERKSRKTVWGMPLYHVGRDARGFIAVGLRARGVFAIGLRARGIVSFGLLSLGILSFGLLSVGLAAFGVCALGILSAGAVALGLFAAGAISVGVIAVGALAIGKYVAVGDHARAMIAVGDSAATGSVYQYVGVLDGADTDFILQWLNENVPRYLAWAGYVFQFFLV